MIFKNIGTFVVNNTHRLVFWARKNSPELLVVSGVVGAAGSIILACKATTKLEKVMTPSNIEIKEIHLKMKDDNKIVSGEYDVQELKKDLSKAYVKTGWNVTKLYAPSVIVFSLSAAAIFGSHKIVKGRNVALAAAYTTIEKGYKNYRERVKNKIGETAERDIFRNIQTEEIIDIKTDKNGKEKETVIKIKSPRMESNADYDYLFDASNPDWNRNGRLNIDYLLGKEKFLNQKLVAQGYLFLYDVYDSLGIEPGMIGETKLQASRIVGWLYDPEDTTRDNYVSFGLADKQGNLNAFAMESLRGNERDVWIEFNPDGDILTGANNTKTFMKFARI